MPTLTENELSHQRWGRYTEVILATRNCPTTPRGELRGASLLLSRVCPRGLGGSGGETQAPKAAACGGRSWDEPVFSRSRRPAPPRPAGYSLLEGPGTGSGASDSALQGPSGRGGGAGPEAELPAAGAGSMAQLSAAVWLLRAALASGSSQPPENPR